MIKNYFDFELDYIIESLLTESKIEFSDRFIDVLKNIKRNKIAKELLYLCTKGPDNIDFPQNYIDRGKVKDEVTFITNRKEKEMLGIEAPIKYKVSQRDRYLTHSPRNKYIYQKLGYTVPNRNPHNPIVGDIGIIKSEAISNKGVIYAWFIDGYGNETVINKSALTPYDDRIPLLWVKNRNPIKIGRLVRSILTTSKIPFTEKELEEFVNAYKSTIEILENAFSKFSLVNGQDIAYWYDKENYADGGESTLGNSCMSEVSSDFFDLYCSNGKVCSLLILFSDNGEINENGKYVAKTIKGRALVWQTEQGDIFMDRIYTNNDSDVELFKKYAFEKGWWCKIAQNSATNFNTTNGTIKKVGSYSVKLEESKFEFYPYLDTFSLINFDENKIANSENLLSSIQAFLNDTDGLFDPNDDFEPHWIDRLQTGHW